VGTCPSAPQLATLMPTFPYIRPSYDTVRGWKRHWRTASEWIRTRPSKPPSARVDNQWPGGRPQVVLCRRRAVRPADVTCDWRDRTERVPYSSVTVAARATPTRALLQTTSRSLSAWPSPGAIYGRRCVVRPSFRSFNRSADRSRLSVASTALIGVIFRLSCSCGFALWCTIRPKKIVETKRWKRTDHESCWRTLG